MNTSQEKLLKGAVANKLASVSKIAVMLSPSSSRWSTYEVSEVEE
jgi:hypothetical protein